MQLKRGRERESKIKRETIGAVGEGAREREQDLERDHWCSWRGGERERARFRERPLVQLERGWWTDGR